MYVTKSSNMIYSIPKTIDITSNKTQANKKIAIKRSIRDDVNGKTLCRKSVCYWQKTAE